MFGGNQHAEAQRMLRKFSNANALEQFWLICSFLVSKRPRNVRGSLVRGFSPNYFSNFARLNSDDSPISPEHASDGYEMEGNAHSSTIAGVYETFGTNQ